MIDQSIMDYLLYRATDRDIQRKIKELSMLPDEVFDGEITLGDTKVTECWFPDNTMCGVAESPTQTIIYFTTKQNYTIFYSRLNKNIQ